MIYLAGPYSHPEAAVRQDRFALYTRLAAHLTAAGLPVYSPITLTHPMQRVMEDELQYSDHPWLAYDDCFMPICGRIIVVDVPGAHESFGVAYELKAFAARGITAQWLTPQEILDLATLQRTHLAAVEALVL